MKPATHAEIAVVEARIAHEREGLTTLAADLGHRARDAVASPAALVSALAVGFVLGDLMRRPRDDAPFKKRRRGVSGLAANMAWAVLRARFRSPWALIARLVSEPRTSRGADAPTDYERAARHGSPGVRAAER